jgi:hypothetical protein
LPKKYKPNFFIFNGNTWYILLLKLGFMWNYEKVKVTEKLNVYFLEIEGIPSVLFDKFFSKAFLMVKRL